MSGGCTGCFYIFFLCLKVECEASESWVCGAVQLRCSSLLYLNILYNRGAWPPVSGGCIVNLIFYVFSWRVECTQGWVSADGKVGVRVVKCCRSQRVVECTVYCKV